MDNNELERLIQELKVRIDNLEKQLSKAVEQEVEILKTETKAHQQKIGLQIQDLQLHKAESIAHKRTAAATIILIAATLLAAIIGFYANFNSDKQSRAIEQAKFANDVYQQYKNEIRSDTQYTNRSTWTKTNRGMRNPAYEIDTINYKKSFIRFLNFYEQINTLYRKDLIDYAFLEDFFYTDLFEANLCPEMHEFIYKMRKQIEEQSKQMNGQKFDSPARIYDGFYICGKRLGIKMNSEINKEDESQYYRDMKEDERFYPCPSDSIAPLPVF